MSEFKETLRECWEYIRDNYFNVTLENYRNFNFSQTATTLSVIIFGLTFGIFLAAIISVFQKNMAGKTVRRLISRGALSGKTALTLDELEGNTPFARFSLRHALVVRKYVCFVSAEKRAALAAVKPKTASSDAPSDRYLFQSKGRIDYQNTAFYVPEEKRIGAELRFDAEGTSWKWVVVTIVVFFVLIFVALTFLPQFIRLLDNLISLIKG